MKPISERFWTKVDRTGGPDSCWEWKAGKNVYGYGHFAVGGRMSRAHRVAYELDTGVPIPKGMYVCHRCDNRACCNPAHLFLGTNADNLKDMVLKGRSACGDRSGPRTHPERVPRGSRQWLSKLTEEDIPRIRQALKLGDAQIIIARRFGVSQRAISLIATGRTWKHV